MKGHSGDHQTLNIEIKLTRELKVFTNVRDLIDFAEGCPLTAYQDEAGVWTIGRGHTKGVYEGMTIT
jgi:GH24 family phage-related lysozyme (muramidase)